MNETLCIILSMLPTIMASISTAIGQGLIGRQALISMDNQPTATDAILKLMIIATAMSETAAIFGFILTLLLLNDMSTIMHTAWSTYYLVGITFALGISGTCAGIASAFPAMASINSVARQPFMQTKILNMMLITQTLIMTPNMFGLIIALMIKGNFIPEPLFHHGMQNLCAGISIGLGCIGPSIGLAFFAYQACLAIGANKHGSNKIMTFTFITQAIIETPIIFSLLVSLLILTTVINPNNLVQPWQFLAAALCMSLSAFFPGISLGKTGATACKQMALHMSKYGNISKLTMLALAMIDTSTIYGLLIAIILLFL